MKVVTILLNWNGKEDTLECLESLSKIKTTSWSNQILLIDNHSTDGSVEAIRKKFPEITFIINDENVGYAIANNQGFRWAMEHKMDYCIVLNNDTVVEEEAFDLLVRNAIEEKDIGALMPLIKYYDNKKVWYAGGKLLLPWRRLEAQRSLKSDVPYEIELFSGCCVLVPTKILSEVGFFDPRYFLYLEDTDLSLRIREKGYLLKIVPKAVIYHKVSRTSGGSVTPTPIYYQVRNNLLLIRDKSTNFLEFLAGYTYMVALSFKILLNVLTRSLVDKRQIIYSLTQAWCDFLLNRLGKRR